MEVEKTMKKAILLVLLMSVLAVAGAFAWDVAYPLYLNPVDVDAVYGSYTFALDEADTVTIQANTVGTYWASVSVYDGDFNVVASYNGWVHPYGWPTDIADFYLYPGQSYTLDITAYSYDEDSQPFLEFSANFNEQNLSYFYFDGK